MVIQYRLWHYIVVSVIYRKIIKPPYFLSDFDLMTDIYSLFIFQFKDSYSWGIHASTHFFVNIIWLKKKQARVDLVYLVWEVRNTLHIVTHQQHIIRSGPEKNLELSHQNQAFSLLPLLSIVRSLSLALFVCPITILSIKPISLSLSPRAKYKFLSPRCTH